MRYYVKEYDATLWRIAEERAAAMPVYAGSHRGRAANQVGALGEVVFEHFLEKSGIPYTARYETTEDLLVCGDTLEVKTKDRTVRPKQCYDCSVPLYNHDHQRPNRYVFVSLLRQRNDTRESITRFSKAWLLGWCTLERLDQVGVQWNANETDPSNGTTFWTSCVNIAVRDLNGMDDLIADYQRRSRL